MFTGIVEALCPVASLKDSQGVRELCVEAPESFSSKIRLGDSVAVNGVCLTKVAGERTSLRFQAVSETLERSNLGHLQEGDTVNLERALKFGDRVGGHLLSGHIWTAIPCIEVECDGDNRFAWFALDEAYARYVLHKGFVALDGVSLTVARVDRESSEKKFGVTLIPETRARTGLGSLRTGILVNLEVDAQVQMIVETVTRILREPGVVPLQNGLSERP